MNQEVVPFIYDGNAVRTVHHDGVVWFVAKDVAAALGYVDSINAVKQHCKGVVKYHPILDRLGRTQQIRIIGEPDLMRLVLSSRLPNAVEFERLVFEEILPSIRRTGSYVSPNAATPDVTSLPTVVGEMRACLRKITEWMKRDERFRQLENRYSGEYAVLVRLLQSRRKRSMSRSEILRKLRTVSAGELNDMIVSMYARGDVELNFEQTGGRPTTVVVLVPPGSEAASEPLAAEI